MPKLSKQVHLEVTVEQFLDSCSLLELQELDMLLGPALQRGEEKKLRDDYRQVVRNKKLSIPITEEDKKSPIYQWMIGPTY